MEEEGDTDNVYRTSEGLNDHVEWEIHDQKEMGDQRMEVRNE